MYHDGIMGSKFGQTSKVIKIEVSLNRRSLHKDINVCFYGTKICTLKVKMELKSSAAITKAKQNKPKMKFPRKKDGL